jgi:hypothetical protein
MVETRTRNTEEAIMRKRSNRFRPEVQTLDERCTPAVVQGWDGVITIYGTRRADFAQVGYIPSGDVFVNDNGIRTLFPGSSVTGIQFFGYGGNDWFYNFTWYDCSCFGMEGTDHLYGGWGSDRLYGGPGADYLYGYGGVDYFSGGLGADTVYYDRYDPAPGSYYMGRGSQTDMFFWLSV